jgi:hypothetical protein
MKKKEFLPVKIFGIELVEPSEKFLVYFLSFFFFVG